MNYELRTLMFRCAVVLAVTLAFPFHAHAQPHRDQILSGGGNAQAAIAQVVQAALGESLGGVMSGGGLTLTGGAGGSGSSNGDALEITAFAPEDKSRYYRQDLVTLSVTTNEPGGRSPQVRFLVDSTVLQDWSTITTATWDTSPVLFGWHTLRVEATLNAETVSKESQCFVFHRPPSP